MRRISKLVDLGLILLFGALMLAAAMVMAMLMRGKDLARKRAQESNAMDLWWCWYHHAVSSVDEQCPATSGAVMCPNRIRSQPV